MCKCIYANCQVSVTNSPRMWLMTLSLLEWTCGSDNKNKCAKMQETCSRPLVSIQIREECGWWMGKELRVLSAGREKEKPKWTCVNSRRGSPPFRGKKRAGRERRRSFEDASEHFCSSPEHYACCRSCTLCNSLSRTHTHTHSERQISGGRESACCCKLNAE